MKKGMVRARLLGLCNFEDPEARGQVWEHAFEAAPAYILKGMFNRCSRSGFEQLSTRAEWRIPLKALFVDTCESFYKHRHYLQEDGKKKHRKAWKDEVARAPEIGWPR